MSDQVAVSEKRRLKAETRNNRNPRPNDMLLGIEIGGTKLQLAIAGPDGIICERQKLSVIAGRGAVGIREQLKDWVPKIAARHNVDGVGIGFGGPVDWRTGRICRSHQIEGWSEFDLSGWLHELTGAPVKVDNDANVGALGEATRGAGAGFNPVFYVTLGSGVGGGLVMDGRIYHGATPGEGEIGHVRLDREGTIVEKRCSGWAVDARIRELAATNPGSLLSRMAKQNPGNEARHLLPALEQNDDSARKLLAEVAEDLAFGLSHVVHLFHPEVIVLGGGFSKTGEPMREAVERNLTRFTMEAFAPGPRIVLAALGEDAVPAGAIELARVD